MLLFIPQTKELSLKKLKELYQSSELRISCLTATCIPRMPGDAETIFLTDPLKQDNFNLKFATDSFYSM